MLKLSPFMFVCVCASALSWQSTPDLRNDKFPPGVFLSVDPLIQKETCLFTHLSEETIAVCC